MTNDLAKIKADNAARRAMKEKASPAPWSLEDDDTLRDKDSAPVFPLFVACEGGGKK